MVGGTVTLFLEEAGNREIPVTRLSDGTLRYLCLLSVPLHPEPPPLVVIEEPELGLHPDLLPTLADLLVTASERSQLIVTTHSDVLVDALTDMPESVVVCEKHDGQTEMRRLDKDDLTKWLQGLHTRQPLEFRPVGRKPLVTVRLYIEGGGDNRRLGAQFREGWTRFFAAAGLGGRMPKVVRGGSRTRTFDRFATDAAERSTDIVPLLLVDSEHPLEAGRLGLAAPPRWRRLEQTCRRW